MPNPATITLRRTYDAPAAERGISWGEIEDMPDDNVYRLFYPDKNASESVFEEPDWRYIPYAGSRGP